MVTRNPPVSRFHWKAFICLAIGMMVLAAAALPAGAGRPADDASAPTAAPSPRVTPPAQPAVSSATVSQVPAAPELLHAIPASDTIPASSPPLDDADPTATPAVPGGKVIWMEVTAYCGCKKCCGPNACGITASGRPISFNNAQFVAADTSVLPFFSRVIIPGYADGQPVPVIDRGSAIKGNHLDVFFPDHETAVAWGKQRIAVTVVP
jgi:3D (Asp-Asp-Asp) domain-containing protein